MVVCTLNGGRLFVQHKPYYCWPYLLSLQALILKLLSVPPLTMMHLAFLGMENYRRHVFNRG